MKTIHISVFVFLVLLVSCQFSIAGNLTYECKVLHAYEPDEGSLRISNWEKQFKGSEFTVSRETGKIIGEVLTTLLADSTKVIHPGNNDYSFKTVAYFKEQIQMLEIKEFSKGKEKPFVAMSIGGAGIVTGLCK